MNNPQYENENFVDVSNEFEQAIIQQKTEIYCLRLYVAGSNFNSTNAIRNIKKICEQYLLGRYTLEVIYIDQKSDFLIKENIFALPTLVKELPLPLQKIIGDLSNTEKVLVSLDIV